MQKIPRTLRNEVLKYTNDHPFANKMFHMLCTYDHDEGPINKYIVSSGTKMLTASVQDEAKYDMHGNQKEITTSSRRGDVFRFYAVKGRPNCYMLKWVNGN